MSRLCFFGKKYIMNMVCWLKYIKYTLKIQGITRFDDRDMNITKEKTAAQLGAYLSHGITLDELVDWAEMAMMEGDFPDEGSDVLAEVIARIGVSDVRAFGLTWEDCESMLQKIGYKSRVEIYSS